MVFVADLPALLVHRDTGGFTRRCNVCRGYIIVEHGLEADSASAREMREHILRHTKSELLKYALDKQFELG